MFAQGTAGKIEASTTRSPCTPRTSPDGDVTAIGSSSDPIRQEHEQCQTPTVARLDIGLQHFVILQRLHQPGDSMMKPWIMNRRSGARAVQQPGADAW